MNDREQALDQEPEEETLKITINGEQLKVEEVQDYCALTILELEDGTEWYVAQDTETAGERARECWEEMAQDDPEEFACMVGEKTLVAWALGQYAGPGSTAVNSLEDWLDLWLDTPEEHWASYDSIECDAEINEALQGELCMNADVVVYRHN